MRHNRFLLAVIIASGLAAVALLARPASMPTKDSEEDDFYGLPNGKGRTEVSFIAPPAIRSVLLFNKV